MSIVREPSGKRKAKGYLDQGSCTHASYLASNFSFVDSLFVGLAPTCCDCGLRAVVATVGRGKSRRNIWTWGKRL